MSLSDVEARKNDKDLVSSLADRRSLSYTVQNPHALLVVQNPHANRNKTGEEFFGILMMVSRAEFKMCCTVQSQGLWEI